MKIANRSSLKEPLERPGRLPLSVIVTTFNEEVHIGECIDSVLWADEVLLVDSFSTDRTLEIAREKPIRILEHTYYGSAAQKNWSLDRVENDWVLILDADERVTEELAREILDLLEKGPDKLGYYIRRTNYLIDKPIRHSGWSTDKVIRLFHRGHGRYPNRRVHADLDIPGEVPVLKEPMIHYTFRSFDQYMEKVLRYAEWGAAQGFKEGKRAGWLEVAFRPLWRFFRAYFLQLGILDGMHGLIVCSLQSMGVFLKYARLWEHWEHHRLGQPVELPDFDDDRSTWALPDQE
jgi:glycosyltransferase involved in cell wall biosynthesis